MLVSDLKDLLEDVDGDLDVYLVVDHGQTPMALNGNGVGYISDYSHMPEEIHPNDVDVTSIKVYMLEAF